MLSLQLPLPKINNGFFLHDRFLCGGRNHSTPYPCSISLPKYRACASSAADQNVVCGGEEVKGRHSDAGVGSTPVEEERLLPAGLQPELMPKHVAVIMDGNVRWAKKRNLPSSSGHKAGARALTELVELCSKWGISVLTVFAFSTENWLRSKLEVNV